MVHEAVKSLNAPEAIGTYSQAIKVDKMVFISGQIPLVPATMTLHPGDMFAQIHQVLDNLRAVAQAAGTDLQQVVKLTVYLTDLKYFELVNKVMQEYFSPPYPARAVVGVASLPRGAVIEVDAILLLP
jgi:reactive intermediate/imine deaminase